jgi:hypothetical protein
VDAQPFTLDEIRVGGEDRRCRVRPEQGQAVARIWEEASKALRATAVTEDDEDLIYLARYRRQELSPWRLTVRWEDTEERVLVATLPFGSVTPEAMVDRGFVHPDGSDYIYYAPDAELLLSDAFLDTHCFRLARPRLEEPGWVGIDFEPIQGRDLPEIQGSVWLDAMMAELRRLEFRYTGGLPVQRGRRHAGGMMAFERLATGAWFVSDWWIRVPRVTRDFRGERLHHFILRGAEIIEVRDRDGEIVGSSAPPSSPPPGLGDPRFPSSPPPGLGDPHFPSSPTPGLGDPRPAPPRPWGKWGWGGGGPPVQGGGVEGG